jgi:serine/threonine-protein kinase RsbW
MTHLGKQVAMNTDTLTVPDSLDSLKPVRDFVKRAAAAAGLDKQSAYRLVLAVDEVAANIILHGYQEAGLTGTVTVEYTVHGDHLRIDLYDNALPYNPHEREDPDHLDRPLEDRPIGGLGVYLARIGTDRMLYEYVDGRNHNTFIVQRTAEAGTPAAAAG